MFCVSSCVILSNVTLSAEINTTILFWLTLVVQLGLDDISVNARYCDITIHLVGELNIVSIEISLTCRLF